MKIDEPPPPIPEGCVRAALTQTVNAFADMPARVDDLPSLQARLDDVRWANLEHHGELAREAKQLGVQVICFGELFTAPYFALTKDAVWHGMAEPRDGPSLAFVSELARELAMVIVAPIYELDGDARYNTALVVDADGELCGFYSKTHVPYGENEQGVFAEHFYFDRSNGRPQAGERVQANNPYFPVFDTAVGRIGVAICYDRHFEGVMSTLASEGAKIVFSPAVTFGAKSARMWPQEFAVDACRNRIYIGGSNRSGVEPPYVQEYFGHSQFVGPEGHVNDMAPHPNLVVADLDFKALEGRDSSGWNFERDWRPDIYGRRHERTKAPRPWDADQWRGKPD
jgi:beta-ureidopropionase